MRKFIALLLILGLLSSCSAPGTVEPTEETTAATEDTTAAEETTEEGKKGCKSVIGMGAVAVMAAAAAVVALKKKED